MDNIVLKKLALYLNKDIPNYRQADVIKISKMTNDKEAINLLLNSFLDTSYDFKKCLIEENEKDYNTQYLSMFNKTIKYKNWSFKYLKYEPFELFVRDDFIVLNDEIIPQIGYFKKPFKYLTLFQNDKEWMSLKPNEINTMKEDINDSFGNVLVAGLGMGYFSYMISLKDNVKSITIVEKDKDIINLFNKVILNNFEYKSKIKIINDDFLNYVENNNLDYDYCYIDIYRDVSDGLNIYKKLLYLRDKYKKMETRFWIEKSMKYYL